MFDSNMNFLKLHNFVADSELNNPNDSRRTIALISDGVYKFHEPWNELEQFLNSTVQSNIGWIQPKLHNTFICSSPFVDNVSLIDVNSAVIDKISSELQTLLINDYTIVFDRIIPVTTGFVLCGTSDKDINYVRDTLRSKGLIKDERYHLDIIHITLLRNVCNITEHEKKNILSQMLLFKRQPYITLQVTAINITIASITMKENTYNVLKRINIHNIR